MDHLCHMVCELEGSLKAEHGTAATWRLKSTYMSIYLCIYVYKCVYVTCIYM